MTKTKFFRTVLFAGAAVTLFSFDVPAGWFKSGDKANSYDMGISKGAGRDGKNAVTILSTDKTIEGFGTLMQNCLPGKYLEKRIRMTGYMKSQDVAQWASFWLRVDQLNSQELLAFDNMEDRPIKGTTDWKKYEIVLDVPQKASNIAYGGLLVGTGQIWFDNLTFEIVDNSVPVTRKVNDPSLPHKEPTNLDFEK